ncbi:MAG: DUF1634 domain-containing protein [Dehalococcoidia bacterium]
MQTVDGTPTKLQSLNKRVGLALRIGIGVALVLVLTGIVISVIINTPHMSGLTPLLSLIPDLLKLSPAAFVTTGLIIILLLPAVILITSFAHFIETREKQPLIVCVILVLMMAASYVLLLK